MSFEGFLKGMAPLVVMGMGLTLSSCEGVQVKMGNGEGVPLSALDLTGPVPTRIALGSGDTVILTEGDRLSIEIEGDDKAREDLRFVRDKDLLGIGRKSGLFTTRDGAPATIRVTMAAPGELMIGGSGTIEAQRLAAKAELAIGGSGTITFTEFTGERLEISIGGSGKVKGAGTAERLEINIGGKGNVDLTGLKTERGEVSIGGSGDVAFASDGTVEANIAGSGTVRVTGRAKCTANSFGSGKLICEPAAPDTAEAP
ncbi:MAG: head GIN domain-containing protein [Erythrobacter sp.]